jgi:ATP-dependent DNA helicase RecG
MAAADDLARLLRSETDRIEWKQSTSQRDAILQAVCALANDLADSRQTGYLLIGVDKSGQPRGIDPEGDLDAQQREVADRLRSSKIQPVPSTSVTIARYDERHLLVVGVEPYAVPPVVEVDGQAWVRVDSSTRRANQADITRLNERRPAAHVPFDTRPLPTTSLGDIEVGELRRVFEAAREGDADRDTFPAFESWLTQKQHGAVVSDRFVPNAATVLVLGKSPQDHLPAAWVDLVRYGGPDRDAAILSRRAATGTVPDQLEAGWTWLALQMETIPAEPSGIRAAFVPLYPEEALNAAEPQPTSREGSIMAAPPRVVSHQS